MPLRQPWYAVSRELVDCAMGRTPADLVIRNGQWACVQSGEIVPNTDIAVKGSRIAYVGPDARHTIGRDTKAIDAAGRYLVPGLLDAHMHVESGMVTVTEFVRAVAPRGTTGMFIDPHEIANVYGLKGVKWMVDEAALQPINVWVEMPSCVPSAPTSFNNTSTRPGSSSQLARLAGSSMARLSSSALIGPMYSCCAASASRRAAYGAQWA